MTFWMRRPIGKNLQGVLLFLLTCVALFFAIRTILNQLDLPATSLWEMPLLYLAPFIATIAVTTLFDRMPVAWSGLALHRRMPREILQGTALGLLMALIGWIPLALTGSVTLSESISPTAILVWTLIILLNAAGEEIIFRGYLFDRGVEIFGQGIGTLLLCGLFAAAHIGAPGMSPAAVTNLVLAGLLFSACRLLSGSIWMSIGVHGAWNVALALLFGVPVSGMEMGNAILRTGLRGPEIITGGKFGPEGGITTTVALLIGGILLFRFPGLQFSPYVFASIFRGIYRQKNAQISEREGASESIDK